jgi:hypothetical protein
MIDQLTQYLLTIAAIQLQGDCIESGIDVISLSSDNSTYEYIRISIYMYMYIHICVHLSIFMYIHKCTNEYVSVHVCMYIYTCICIYMYYCWVGRKDLLLWTI